MPLQFKVYATDAKPHSLVAACRDTTTAAWVVAMGTHLVVKFAGRIIWREGREEFLAADSANRAALVMDDRVREVHAWHYAKVTGATGGIRTAVKV